MNHKYTIEEILKLSIKLKTRQFKQLKTLKAKGLSENTIIALYDKLLKKK